MTTPNPTPTTREREVAREIMANFVASAKVGRDFDLVLQDIAAALVRARREALTEVAEYLRANQVAWTASGHKIVDRSSPYGITEGDIYAIAIERWRDTS